MTDFTTPVTCESCPHSRTIHATQHRAETKKQRGGLEVWCPSCKAVCGDVVSVRVRYRKKVPREHAVGSSDEWEVR